MSREKIYNTIGMSEETWRLVEEVKHSEIRSRGWIIERILREYFKNRGEWVTGEVKNADKT